MTPLQKKLAQLSRDRSFIIRAAIGIGFLFFVIGFLLHLLSPGKPAAPENSASGAPETARDYAELIRGFGHGGLHIPRHLSSPDDGALTSDTTAPAGFLNDASLQPGTIDLLSRFHSALTGSPGDIPRARAHFESFHSNNPDQPLAAGFAAYLYALGGDASRALPLYITEGAFPGASFERAAAITIATNNRDRATLERILELPGFREDIPGHPIEDQVSIITRDFTGLMSNQFDHWLRVLHPGHFAVSLVTGSVWFLILFGTLALKKRHLPIALVSVAAGVFSTALTLSLYSLQNFYTEVAPTGAIFDDAVYWIAGVGLREEFSKLLCFALLIPFLRPFNSGALAFACASFVGLGFAVEENNQYFNSSFSSAATSRFLTANFLHFSTTGIAGYYLYKLSFGFRGRWEAALGAFLFVVFLHGAYDLLLSINLEIRKEIGFLYIVIIGILAFNHAKMTDQLRPHGRAPVVSPLAIFVLGTAVILGLSFAVFVSAAGSVPVFGELYPELGKITFAKMVSIFGTSSLSSIIIAFLFINRFRSA